MLPLADAVKRAEVELAQDTNLLGARVLPGPGVETPHFWVFYPNSEHAFETGSAADSLSYRIPPVMVDRRDGSVTRPVAASEHLRAADLGPEEWFILQPTAPRPHDAMDDLALGAADIERIAQLRYFRFRRGGRDSGDALEATLVAEHPAALASGLRAAGLEPAPRGWVTSRGEQVAGCINAESATATLTLAGSDLSDSPWSVSPPDVAAAEHIEAALAGAEWIRFWL